MCISDLKGPIKGLISDMHILAEVFQPDEGLHEDF